MKGLILSGGAGTRLRPITHTSAKQLVPIANKPILFYGIEALAEAGVDEIGIIIGETGEEVREAVGDGSKWGVSVSYIQQDDPLGLAHCVLIAEDFLGEDDFIMYLGDNMLEQGLTEMIKRFNTERSSSSLDCRILLKQVENPQSFGVATIDNSGRVTGLVEKPENPPSDLALVGVYLFTSVIHEAVKAISPSGRGELEITDAIQWLINDGKIVSHDILDGWWIDTGKKDPLLECNKLILETLDSDINSSSTIDDASKVEGMVRIGSGTEIINSSISGPSVIGDNVYIINSQIGPFSSIGDNCSIINGVISNSVLLSDCSIEHSGSISNSLLGKSSQVRNSTSDGEITLMLGDDSVVEIS